MADLSNLLAGQSNLVTTQMLSTVATSGSYVDLTNKPTLAAVATSGSYVDLSNKPTVISLKGTSVTYPGNDLAADTAGAQTILITGTGFESTPTVYIGGTIAPSVTFVSSTQITVTTPAKTAGTYDIYIVNPGGATAIMVMGISYSGVPTWTTSAGSLGTLENNWTVQLQATSNSTITYALTSGSVLPTGVTLSSSGLITGTDINTEQTFNFSVTATDLENQDTPRSFSITITLGEPYFKYTTLLLTGNGAAPETKTYTVTNSGASDYLIDGVGDPTLTLVRGSTYIFNVTASGHPFWIKTTAVTGTASAYSTGITNNGTESGTVTFVVPSDAPATLYYICQFHGSMVGTINIVNAAIQNNTFLDSSANNRTVTLSGNVTQGSFSPYGPNWSNCFTRGATQGDNTAISFPNIDAYRFGTGDFTVEAWVNPTRLTDETSSYYIVAQCADSSSWSNGWTIYIQQNQLGLWSNEAPTAGGTVPVGVWSHIAVSRQGTTVRLFINGTVVNTSSSSHNFAPSRSLSVGGEPGGGYAFPSGAFISNLRVVKGTAVYTNNFVPPTEPLTAISGTSLLTCQSNRIVDRSPIAAIPVAPKITVTNLWPSIERFNPFGAVSAYSANTIGGSAYFDGNNGNLSTTVGTIGTGPFTIECWLYNTLQNNQPIFALGSYITGIDVRFDQITSNVISGYIANTGYTFVSNPIRNQWIHFALTRDSGNTIRAFYNGNLTLTSSGVTANIPDTTLNLGKLVDGGVGGNQRYNGYMSDFRYVIGTAVYTSAFTPPTSPLTAVSGTNLLCKFTNASIIDSAMMNNLETVGNAQISTSVVKYGTGSMSFNGSNSYLTTPYSQNQNFGTGNFTIEGWVYLNSLSASYYCPAGTWTTGTTDEWLIQISNANTIRFLTTAGTSFYSATITTNTWYHIAAVRNGSTIALYVNGTSVGSYTNTNSIGSVSKPLHIGAQPAPIWYWNGYIDDFRITKGYARYTANFTPPTTALGTK